MDLWPNLPRAILVTVTDPVFDPVRRDVLATHADLVDMEGAALAHICRERTLPFHALKGVSDQAGAVDRDRLLANLDTLCETLAELFWSTTTKKLL